MRRVQMDRHETLMRSQTEKDMRVYQRQIKMARHQRRDEYRRAAPATRLALAAPAHPGRAQTHTRTLPQPLAPATPADPGHTPSR